MRLRRKSEYNIRMFFSWGYVCFFGLKINIVAATAEEIAERQTELDEEARVKAIVKQINANNKKAETRQKTAANNKEQYFKRKITKPKFPGAK